MSQILVSLWHLLTIDHFRVAYRKIPVISPGPIQLHKGFGWAYKRRGLYPGWGGGVFVSGTKNCFVFCNSAIKWYNKLIMYFNSQLQQRKTEIQEQYGQLYFTGRWAYNRPKGLIPSGGYNRDFTVVVLIFIATSSAETFHMKTFQVNEH